MADPALLQGLAQMNPAQGLNEGIQSLSNQYQNQVKMGLMVQDQKDKQKQAHLDTGIKMFEVADKLAKLKNPYFLQQAAEATKAGMKSWANYMGKTDTSEIDAIDTKTLMNTKSLSQFISDTNNTIKAFRDKTISEDDLNKAFLTGARTFESDFGATTAELKTYSDQFTEAKAQQKQIALGQAINEYKNAPPELKKKASERLYELDTKTAMEIEKAQKEADAPSGDTYVAAERIMKDNPGMTFTEAYKIAKRQSPEEAGSIQTARNLSDLSTAFALALVKAQGEIAGKGEITPTRKKAEAQQQVSDILTSFGDLYTKLDKMGSIVNVKKSSAENVLANLSASTFGQTVGKVTGSEAQSLRNQINQQRPLLINHIRQASNMGARGLDSEKELEFYLEAATDTKKDIATNLAALQVLDNAYGLGMGIKADDKSVGSLQKEFKAQGIPSIKVGTVLKGYKFKGGDPSKESNWIKVK